MEKKSWTGLTAISRKSNFSLNELGIGERETPPPQKKGVKGAWSLKDKLVFLQDAS